eukprot:1374624-Amorphochlora_amoeboformis.AAC.2
MTYFDDVTFQSDSVDRHGWLRADMPRQPRRPELANRSALRERVKIIKKLLRWGGTQSPKNRLGMKERRGYL